MRWRLIPLRLDVGGSLLGFCAGLQRLLTGRGRSGNLSVLGLLLLALPLVGLGVWLWLAAPGRQGLSGTYFWNTGWDGSSWREDVLDTDISHRAPDVLRSARRAPGGRFSVEWVGCLHVPETGHYSFSAAANGEAWVWLDGIRVAASANQAAPESRELREGPHPIRIRYLNRGGKPLLDVRFGQSGTSLQPIDGSLLSPPALPRRASRIARYGAVLLLLAAAALLRRDLVLLFAVVLYVNTPYLSSVVWDSRDTNTAFQLFYVHYNEAYHSGQLPLWLPYGTYGQPVDLTLSLSGVQYLGVLAGKLLEIRNVWALFVFTTIVEQTLLLLGLFLLARRLYASRAAVLMVCLAAMGSLVWYWHYFFSLRMVCLLPLLLYWILRFFETRRPHHLWLAGSLAVFWAQGSSFSPAVWLFVCFVFAVPLTVAQPGIWRSLFCPSRENVLTFIAFAAATSCFVVVAARGARDLSVLKNDRDPQTGRVALDVFLGHGGTPKPGEVAANLLSGNNSTNDWDNNLYAGLLPLFCLAWALFRVRSARFAAVAGAALALVWLAFGGQFARLIYYFPLMGYYRWLAWTWPTTKLLLILAAGFGFEQVRSEPRPVVPSVIVALVMLFCLDAAGVSAQAVLPEAAAYLVAVLVATLLARTPGVPGDAVRRRFGRSGLLSVAAIGALAFDLHVYQQQTWRKLPRVSASAPGVEAIVSVERLQYDSRRSEVPTTARGAEALLRTIVTYAPHTYAFMSWDPCRIGSPDGYVQTLPRRTATLLGLDMAEPPLSQVLGCTTPKLRVVADVVTAEEPRAAADLMRKAAHDRQAVVEGTFPDPERSRPTHGSAGEARVTHFDANTLEAEVDVAGGGGWLVYADGYHPGWRAAVNGRPAPVFPANLAFKAVRLSPGHSHVRLVYWDRWASFGAYVLAAWSAMVTVALLAWAIVVSLRASPG